MRIWARRVAALLPFIPGAVARVGRFASKTGLREAGPLATMAARLGKTEDELEVFLSHLRNLDDGSQGAARRVEAAIRVGGDVDPADLALSFWEGIALARAGKSSKAIAAFRRFVSKYPKSSRAGEAAAKLGWLLYDVGDLVAAERYFKSASDDVVPKVQESARDGLESIARKREAP